MSVTGGLSLLISIMVISGFAPDLWLCDIASQLRLVYSMLLLLCLAILLSLRSHIGAALVLCVIALNACPIMPMHYKPSCAIANGARTISILNFNTEYQHNDRYDLLTKLITDRNPDIVVLVETNRKWIENIEPVTQRYHYRKIVMTGPGMALFSAFPIERCDVRYFGRSHHPRIIATVRLDGDPVQIVIAHPTTPRSKDAYTERNQEIAILRREMTELPSPKLFVGDLNCGPWSSAFRDLLKAGLRDSEEGFGPQPTWPARNGRVIEGIPIPPLVPIDHVLISKDICVESRAVGPAMGSDHLPVFITIEIPSQR